MTPLNSIKNITFHHQQKALLNQDILTAIRIVGEICETVSRSMFFFLFVLFVCENKCVFLHKV